MARGSTWEWVRRSEETRHSDVSLGVRTCSLAVISIVLISSNLPHAGATFLTLLSRRVCTSAGEFCLSWACVSVCDLYAYRLQWTCKAALRLIWSCTYSNDPLVRIRQRGFLSISSPRPQKACTGYARRYGLYGIALNRTGGCGEGEGNRLGLASQSWTLNCELRICFFKKIFDIA